MTRVGKKDNIIIVNHKYVVVATEIIQLSVFNHWADSPVLDQDNDISCG